MSNNHASEAALKQIDLMLNKHGRTTNQFGLPKVTHHNTEYDRLLHAFPSFAQANLARDLRPKLTAEQKTIFDAVTDAALNDKGGIFMIDAPAGTGKTFTECAITAHIRAHGKLVLCTATTGIASLILPGDLTAHSTFKLPFGDDAIQGSLCNIAAESQRADVLQRSS